jgi:hypothetical protein
VFGGEWKFDILDIEDRDFCEEVESEVFVGLEEGRVFI